MTASLPVLGYGAFALTLALISAINLFWGVPIDAAKVPMPWGLDGNPTWYAPKAIGLWFPLVFAALIGSILIRRARHAAPPPVIRE